MATSADRIGYSPRLGKERKGAQRTARGRPASYGYTTRGLAYWKSKAEQRLFLATGDAKLFAIDPKTGTRIKTFGKDGAVDLKQGLHRSIKGLERMMNYSGPPVVCRDLVIIGSIICLGDGMAESVKSRDGRFTNTRSGSY